MKPLPLRMHLASLSVVVFEVRLANGMRIWGKLVFFPLNERKRQRILMGTWACAEAWLLGELGRIANCAEWLSSLLVHALR